MNQSRPPEDLAILDSAWRSVVGGLDWLNSVLLGEFADNRPLSAVVADMLVSFVPGVVIVTSARDAIAVILRLAKHPDKREDLMEWVLLCACLIVIALPFAAAAAGALGVGAGAIVGGIAGSELGAALRGVMLMLIKEASRLVELVLFLQKFIQGDILKFLRAVKFVRYEKALIQAFSRVLGKLMEIVAALRTHLESLHYFDRVRAAIANLAEWEKRFYSVQQDALKQIPLALVELDARLAKVLAETAPKEAHTVLAGVQARNAAVEIPVKQRIKDTPGKVLAQHESDLLRTRGVTTTEVIATPSVGKSPKTLSKSVPKDTPDAVVSNGVEPNTKKQNIFDAAVTADRERITQLSREANDAQKIGNKALAAKKIEEAREILRPHLPKNPGDTWGEVIKRLDVSSPRDGAVFWSGDAKIAQKFADKIGGVTLETSAGGKIIDGWDEVNKGYAWDSRYGKPPYAKDLWLGVSKKYAEGVTGKVYAVQTTEKLWDTGTIWHSAEKPIIQDKMKMREVTDFSIFTINKSGEYIGLSENYIKSLLRLKEGV